MVRSSLPHNKMFRNVIGLVLLIPLLGFAASPPSLQSPSNNATNVSASSQGFNWTSVSGATGYRIVVADNPSFNGFDDTGKGDTSCTNHSKCKTAVTSSSAHSGFQLEHDETWYWKVRATNSDWSSVYSFTTEPLVGAVKGTLYPSSVRSDGAFKVHAWHGELGWYDSGTTVSGLTDDTVTVTFKDVAGWQTPSDQSVTVTKGGVTNFSATYVALQTPQPNLIVRNLQLSQSQADPSESFTVIATVENIGDSNSNSTTLRYYRSNDSTISTSDTLLSTDPVSSLSPNGTSVESDLNSISSPGTYYIGACVDEVANESTTNDNCSEGVQLVINQPLPTAPDLSVPGVQLNQTEVVAGEAFTITAQISNTGDASSSSTTLRYYQSNNSTISTSDTQLTTDQVASLSPNQVVSESENTNIATIGTYYIGGCIDTVNNESDTGNNCSNGVQIEVVGLGSASQYVTPNPGFEGDTYLFYIQLEGSLPSNYDIQLELGDGGGGWLAPISMPATDATRIAFSIQREIAQAGERNYRFKFLNNGNFDRYVPSSGSYTYTVNPRPPEFISSNFSANEAPSHTFTAYWRQANNHFIVNALLRYRLKNTSEWNQVDMPYNSDLTAENIAFQRTVSISNPGEYEYQFRASASTTASNTGIPSDWTSSQSFTVSEPSTPARETISITQAPQDNQISESSFNLGLQGYSELGIKLFSINIQNYEASEALPGTYQSNSESGDPTETHTFSVDISGLEDGHYEIIAHASDLDASNGAEITANYEFYKVSDNNSSVTSKTCSQVNEAYPYECLVESSAFSTQDNVYSWAEFSELSNGDHLVEWFFYNDADNITEIRNLSFHWDNYNWYRVNVDLENKQPGSWRVEVWLDGVKLATNYFTISNPTPENYELSVTTTGQGNVSSSGIDCGPSENNNQCSNTYEEGRSITLNAEPLADFYFVDWSYTSGCHFLDQTPTEAQGSIIEINLVADCQITANFSQTDSPTGSVKASLFPTEIQSNAKFRVQSQSGFSDWYSSGFIVSGIEPGTVTIHFSKVSGWTAPPSQTINVQANEVLELSATYTQDIASPTLTNLLNLENCNTDESKKCVRINKTVELKFDISDINNNLSVLDVNWDGMSSPETSHQLSGGNQIVTSSYAFSFSDISDCPQHDYYRNNGECWKKDFTVTATAYDTDGNASNVFSQTFILYDLAGYNEAIQQLNEVDTSIDTKQETLANQLAAEQAWRHDVEVLHNTCTKLRHSDWDQGGTLLPYDPYREVDGRFEYCPKNKRTRITCSHIDPQCSSLSSSLGIGVDYHVDIEYGYADSQTTDECINYPALVTSGYTVDGVSNLFEVREVNNYAHKQNYLQYVVHSLKDQLHAKGNGQYVPSCQQQDFREWTVERWKQEVKAHDKFSGTANEISSLTGIPASEIARGLADGTAQALFDVARSYAELPGDVANIIGGTLSLVAKFVKDPVGTSQEVQQTAAEIGELALVIASDIDEVARNIDEAIEHLEPYRRAYFGAYIGTFVAHELAPVPTKLLKVTKLKRPQWLADALLFVRVRLIGYKLPWSEYQALDSSNRTYIVNFFKKHGDPYSERDIELAELLERGLKTNRKRMNAIIRGNKFNRERWDPNMRNELYLCKHPNGCTTNPKQYVILDAYDQYSQPPRIISRKHTQLARIPPQQRLDYIDELVEKYRPGMKGAEVESNINGTKKNMTNKGMNGQEIVGEQVLQIPKQDEPIPQNVLDRLNALKSEGIIVKIEQVPSSIPYP